ncbi:Gamma-glutamyl phosphate reductase [Labilithrix luteola]|uniref:Gamma-glutamyl phosphate reductase n=1 Tax=Labilithrix luteola TaxID=1391654 RepID=A0A0K1QAF4_9BACT|nr:glutamate-5-semialdehyde dehydrogenase [Labilithrix luteola]AKV02766.1 Gamma-glutamyl phosphate reductase [Labilithrix luteola]
MTPLDAEVRAICERARKAARKLAPRPRAEKDAALEAVAQALETNASTILAANAADVAAAREKGTTGAMLDRLTLDASRLAGVAKSVREVVALPDPVGEVVSRMTRDDGLLVSRVRVPLGVVAMIYEARPNVTVEASALTLKAGNAVVLRGGSEAVRSNAALAEVLTRAIESAALPADAVQILPFTDRDGVRALVQQSDFVDLAIPRGGEALIRFVTENARVPVVQHYKGVCHVFLDAGVDLASATRIVLNAKMQRPGVCNALECLLVDAKDAERILPPVAKALLDAGCELHGDERTLALAPAAKPAAAGDWGKEFLDTVLAIRVVDGLDGALAHIAEFGSGHTEAILTPDAARAERFRREVDAACVVVNASTRFHDGGELGLGAEIGIATSRLHWRGPMGLESLTTMKWIVDGAGQIRA